MSKGKCCSILPVPKLSYRLQDNHDRATLDSTEIDADMKEQILACALPSISGEGINGCGRCSRMCIFLIIIGPSAQDNGLTTKQACLREVLHGTLKVVLNLTVRTSVVAFRVRKASRKALLQKPTACTAPRTGGPLSRCNECGSGA